jgi:hypothetical protein
MENDKSKNMHALKSLAKICKYMHIQTETTESLFTDSYGFLKVHMIGVRKKNMLFHTLHNTTYYSLQKKEYTITRLL